MVQKQHRIRQVTLEGVPATFYVGPAGVLVVAESPLVAETEARRVWGDSGRAIPVLRVVLNPGLEEPQGRVEGVLALRDEGAIKDYLRGRRLLDNDEVDLVAGWLQNRTYPPPSIRPKGGRHLLREEVDLKVMEERTKAPPRPLPKAPPRPHLGQVVWRALGWRVVFLPELATFAVPGKCGTESPLLWWLLVGGLLLRFWASFGNEDPLGWKRWVLVTVGALELAFVWALMPPVWAAMPDVAAHLGKLPLVWYWLVVALVVILVSGLVSLFRGIWLFWPGRKSSRAYFPSRGRVR